MPDRGRARRVRLLKVALPAAALALIGAVFLFSGRGEIEGLRIEGLAVDPEQGLRLTNPRFTGETDDGRPFVLTADWALPDGPDPTRVELGPMRGQIALDPERRLTLTARSGELFPKDERVRLGEGVEVELSDGHSARATAIEIDIAGQTARSDGPVAGEGPLGAIEAGAMRAARRDGADYIWFEGGVRVRANPAAGRATDAGGERAP
jgi:lipopolysaccharide export system protein LptC